MKEGDVFLFASYFHLFLDVWPQIIYGDELLLLISAFPPSWPRDNIHRKELLRCNFFKTTQGKGCMCTWILNNLWKPLHKLLGQHHQYLPSTSHLFNRDSLPSVDYSNYLLFLQWSLAIVMGGRLRTQKLHSHNPSERSDNSAWTLLSCNKWFQ